MAFDMVNSHNASWQIMAKYGVTTMHFCKLEYLIQVCKSLSRDYRHSVGISEGVLRPLTLTSGIVSDVIDRALAKNVRAALVVTENIRDFEPVIELYKRFPAFVLPCLGLHPIQSTGTCDESGIEVKRSVSLQDYVGVEAAIERFADVIGAIGEIGLDFSPRFCKTVDDKEVQKLILTKQVQLAQKHNLPVNVHSRSAGKQTIQLLKELDARHVLLHAFDGRASTALEGVANGFYFSVTASICRDPQDAQDVIPNATIKLREVSKNGFHKCVQQLYVRWQKCVVAEGNYFEGNVQKMVKALPLERLMLETDSPAIAPVKGAVNEPSNVCISCEHIARIKNVDVEQVRHITTENAIKVFPKLKLMIDT